MSASSILHTVSDGLLIALLIILICYAIFSIQKGVSRRIKVAARMQLALNMIPCEEHQQCTTNWDSLARIHCATHTWRMGKICQHPS